MTDTRNWNAITISHKHWTWNFGPLSDFLKLKLVGCSSVNIWSSFYLLEWMKFWMVSPWFPTFDPGSSCRETIITPVKLKWNPWMTWHNPQRPTVPLSACKNNLLWIKSKGPCQCRDVTVLCESNSTSTSRHRSLRPFHATLLTLKKASHGDISIQETCWHTYQTSQRQVSFPEDRMGVIEMLKGRLDPNITKGWKDMNMLWLKAKTAKGGLGGGWNAFWG